MDCDPDVDTTPSHGSDSETTPTTSATLRATKSGAKATRFPFTKEQQAYLQRYIPEFEEKVLTVDPKFQGRNPAITAWKDERAKAALNHEDFAVFPNSEKRSRWREVSTLSVTLTAGSSHRVLLQAIVRFYSNHLNNKMKKGRTATATSSLTSTAATAKDDLSKLIRSRILLTGESSPQQVFADEMDDQITSRYQELARAEGIPGGGAKARVIKEMWEKENHQPWIEKAAALKNDIEA